MALNTLVAMEVFYLFSVRYLRAASITWEGMKGTQPVLIAVAIVIVLQALVTLRTLHERPVRHPAAFADPALPSAPCQGLCFW